MAAASRPVLLDVTRTVSRVGGGPATGIDRVERAWLARLLAREVELSGLCRTAAGQVVLDRAGLAALLDRIDGRTAWGAPDLAGRASLRISRERRAAESDVRRLGRSARLPRGVPEGALYLNVGHANLSDGVMAAVRRVPGATVAVLVHDVIPLRLPWTQRAGASERFAAKLAVVARHADAVLCPSEAEAREVARELAARGGRARLVVAPPGVAVAAPDAAALAQAGAPGGAYFVAVGTMEPRKNLGLLLDLWEALARERGEELPALCLVGRRGWESAAFFRRLDALKARLPAVREHGGLSDGALAALVAGARGLLFPSLAEGYGLPPLEAAALGVRPVCAPLAVYGETLGDAAVYADPGDLYQWKRAVLALEGSGTGAGKPRKLPDWDDHVNAALGGLG